MILDVFPFFRASSKKMIEACSAAYPGGKMETSAAIRSVCQINGINIALKAVLEHRIETRKEDNPKFRNINDNWEPSVSLDLSQDEKPTPTLNCNYIRILSGFTDDVASSVAHYQKNGDGVLHPMIQQIQGHISMLNHFLNSIEPA